MRADLLHLTSDDLILLANRGLFRRAQQELESAELSFSQQEDAAGNLTITWSDSISVVFEANKSISAARCSCPATSMCRHILRSVLAYQQQADTAKEPDAVQQPWNPALITDTELGQFLSRSQLSWARKAFDEGQVIELLRSSRPGAHIYTMACTVRFLMPGNLRYCRCDCGEQLPCRHVALAIWAFRMLPEEQQSAIIETAQSAQPVPDALLRSIETILRELIQTGISNAASPLLDRLRRLEAGCREAQLVWPAEIIQAMLLHYDAYLAHDARFSATELASLMGELCVRCDAIRYATGAVPQLFIRGGQQDTEANSTTARLVGLGCGVRLYRGGVELFAVLQDSDTGRLLAIARDLPDQDASTAIPFWRGAQRIVAQGISLAQLGSGQLLVKGGKRLPSARFVIGRARLSYNPQAYAWESLRAPVFSEAYTDLIAHLAAQPPAALGPRRLSDAIHTIAIAQTGQLSFDIPTQEIRAELYDTAGSLAQLRFPYHHRAADGAEALLQTLKNQAEQIRFIAGHCTLAGGQLMIRPIGVILQEGSQRRMLMPWVAAPDKQLPGQAIAEDPEADAGRADVLQSYWADVLESLGELLLTGLAQADGRSIAQCQLLEQRGKTLGFQRTSQIIARLGALLHSRTSRLDWDAAQATSTMLELLCLMQFTHAALVEHR